MCVKESCTKPKLLKVVDHLCHRRFCLLQTVRFVQPMSDSIFVSHIISQTRANIDFLQAQGHLTVEDAANMRSKLAEANAKAPGKPVNTPVSTPWLPLDPVPTYYQPHPPHPSQPPQPPQLTSPPQPTPNYSRARALWAYNEDGRVRRYVGVTHTSPSCSSLFLRNQVI